MKPNYKGELIPKAKEMRKNATHSENRLWYSFLSKYPIKFRRQRPIKGLIADFYCEDARLVIEVDGNQHLTMQGDAYDTERSAVFYDYGIDVLRFSNYEIENCFNEVCKIIDENVKERINNNNR